MAGDVRRRRWRRGREAFEQVLVPSVGGSGWAAGGGPAEAVAFRPDVVLLDIGRPKLNGYDAARRIRQEPWGRDMVLVACTGWGQEEDRRRSQEAGFNTHLVKPVDPAALEELLADLEAKTA